LSERWDRNRVVHQWSARFPVSPGGPIGYLKLLPVGSDSAPLESRSDRSGSQQRPTIESVGSVWSICRTDIKRSTQSRGVDRARANRLHTLFTEQACGTGIIQHQIFSVSYGGIAFTWPFIERMVICHFTSVQAQSKTSLVLGRSSYQSRGRVWKMGGWDTAERYVKLEGDYGSGPRDSAVPCMCRY